MAVKRGKPSTDESAMSTSVDEGLEPIADAQLASAIPANLTIDVELPARVHEQPDDEKAVALVESGVDPSIVAPTEATTTVIEFAGDDLHRYLRCLSS